MSRCVCLILVALAATPAAAAETGYAVRDASDLTQLCAGQPPGAATVATKEAAIVFCHGFAQGVVADLLAHEPNAFCVPKPSPSRTQTLGEYALWVRAKPERAAEKAAASLVAFFKERFPCG